MSNVRFSGYCERELFISSDEKFPSLDAVPGNEAIPVPKSRLQISKQREKAGVYNFLSKGKKDPNVSRAMFNFPRRH